jgi:hypothetical protein
MRTLARLALLAVLFVLAPTRADDTFFRAPLSKLTITEGKLPTADESENRVWGRTPVLVPRIVLDGPGEAYLGGGDGASDAFWLYRWSMDDAVVVGRAPAGQPVKGALYIPDAALTRLVKVRFSLTPDAGAPEMREAFFRARTSYYERLQSSGAPGAAYFRRQADLARRELGEQSDEARRFTQTQRDLDDTYDLFTGGRAVSENLQLSRPLPAPPDAKADDAEPDRPVALSTIKGITVPEFDWSSRLTDTAPALDPLAAAIPADQHAIFFPSFDALIATLDRSTQEALPIFRTLAARSQDARLAERYERQLCLPPTVLARLLGPSVIKSVAVTGSDPYFPTGTDVALVFEPVDAQALRQVLLAQVRLTAGTAPAASGDTEGVHYEGAATPDRAICSYVAAIGDAVVVTNSLAQLRRLGAVHAGSAPAISTLPEYRFFRTRYARGEGGETALVFLSDATIRRWCGPEWRIGASRRLRAAAILADTTAAHVEDLGRGSSERRPAAPDTPMRTIGQVTLSPERVSSSVYGTLAFMTPIAELGITEVAPDEAAAYKRWRDGYQQNWRWAFDPIAARLTLDAERAAMDLSVVPLILGTDYRTWLSFAEGASIAPGAGDPHDAMVHGVVAINAQSRAIKELSGMASMMAPQVQVEPLAWLGQSVAVYLDPDPFWAEVLASKDPRFMDREAYRLPVAVHAEVASAMKLAAFLTAARSFVEQSAPDITTWETRQHGEQAYVRVGVTPGEPGEAPENADKLAVYYAATPKALIVSLREDVLQRALDRQAKRKTEQPATQPWLGSSMALRFNQEGLGLLRGPGGPSDHEQDRAWMNLPILNEWKRLFPDQDPVVVHERLWGVRLVSPGGGTYAWNEASQTMESSVYGSPADPKAGPEGANPLGPVRGGDLGVTFEDKGLRARAVLQLAPAK